MRATFLGKLKTLLEFTHPLSFEDLRREGREVLSSLKAAQTWEEFVTAVEKGEQTNILNAAWSLFSMSLAEMEAAADPDSSDYDLDVLKEEEEPQGE
jgi:hypothetical protein